MRLAASSVALAALLAVSTPVLAAPVATAAAATTATQAQSQAQPLRGAPVSELIARVDIPWQRFQLDNGLTVLVHEDRKAPVVAVSVWYNVGSKDEPKGSTGFAHLFEHLMFGGSENSPSSHIQTMNAAGATGLNGTTWFDRTNYFQTVPTPALEYTLYLESDRMGYLLGQVSQEVLDLQRGVVQNEKRQGDNQPYGMTYYATLEALFPEGHPYRQYMRDNVWPTEIEGFRQHVYGLYEGLDELGRRILKAIARYLKLDDAYFEDKVQLGNSVLRLLHYPPIPADAEGVRAGAHEDINVITLLLGAEEAGLQLKDSDGEWLDIAPPPGALVVNIGDMLQRLVNHVLPSTTHRVVNPAPERRGFARYSTPFFLHFNPDFPIETLPSTVTPENPDRYAGKTILAEDFLTERLKEIRLI